jgi:hypothetical protein
VRYVRRQDLAWLFHDQALAGKIGVEDIIWYRTPTICDKIMQER